MSYRSVRVCVHKKIKKREEETLVDKDVKVKRIMVTLPEELVQRLEDDTARRGLNLTKSNRIQLMLEKELAESEKKETDEK